jgi:hypothetical protein
MMRFIILEGMMKNKELIEQTKLAFDFIHKVYLETSYLVKEIEGLLSEEEERFVIGRPSGYHVSARSSTGLEARLISLWTMRSLSVFFAPEDMVKNSRGQTITNFENDPKVLLLRAVFDDPEIDQPMVFFGTLENFKPINKKWEKVEHVIGHIGYYEDRVYGNLPKVDYKDSYIEFTGHLFSVNLFDVNSSEDIKTELLAPALELFRG